MVRKDPIRDLPLTGLSAAGSADIKLAVQKDNVVLASGPNPDTAVYTLSGRIEAPSLSGLRLEVQPDKSLPKNGPGRASNGNFVVTGLKVEISSNESFDKATEVEWSLGIEVRYSLPEPGGQSLEEILVCDEFLAGQRFESQHPVLAAVDFEDRAGGDPGHSMACG